MMMYSSFHQQRITLLSCLVTLLLNASCIESFFKLNIKIPKRTALVVAYGTSSPTTAKQTIDNNKADKQCVVTFQASKELYSEKSFPYDEDLLAFFQNQDNLNLLLGAGKKDPDVIVIHDSDDEKLMNLYKKQCEELQLSNNPNQDIDNTDEVRFCQVNTSSKFPGLEIVSTSVMGTKLNKKDDDYGSPEYQVVLVDTCDTPRGLKPIVWLYNKLTGNSSPTTPEASDVQENQDDDGSSDTEQNGETGASALTYISTVPVAGGNSFKFKVNSSFNIHIKFPTVMMKLIPGGIDKMEENGSKSVQKVLDKNIEPSLKLWCEAYESWTDSKTRP